MEISVNETEYCKLLIDYEADADQIDNKRTEVLTLFKRAPVPGFRKGKIPMESIKIYYHGQIEDSLKRALAEEAYHNVIFDKNIKPLGSPDFKSIELVKDKFKCQFSLNKKPDFELKEYKGLIVPKPVAQDPVELAAKMLEDLRTQHGTSTPFDVDDFITMGDNAVIDYEAFDGDAKIDFLSAQGELLTVGHSQLKAFDDALLGMKAGETRTFTIPLSAELNSALAGKLLTFTVTLHTGSKVVPMPLNDELGQKLGKKDLQELLQLVAGNASSRVQDTLRADTLKAMSNALLANHEFEVPGWLSLSEAQYLTANARMTWETMTDDSRHVYLSLAEANVKLGLILDKIRDAEPEAQLSDQEVIDVIKKSLDSSASGVKTDDALQAMSKNGYLPILVARIRDEHTLDFILKNSKIVE